MADKVEVVDIKDESEAEGKLETLNDEDAPDFNEISGTVALEEQKEEVEQENPQEATQEEVVDVKTTAEAKKEDLKQLVTCPDCGTKLQLRGLKYTHKRYCKGKKPDVDVWGGAPTEGGKAPFVPKTPKAKKASQVADIEDVAPPGLPPPSPPPLVRQTAVEHIENTQPTIVPTHEQIAAYSAQERKMKAEKKRVRINNLINQAF